LLGVTLGQVAAQVDDFQCPDEFLGFYPHLISCDKYWSCRDGIAELKTCGNGLGFLDTDDTFTLEQCAELHLVECGDRTELEPPISTEHCPRLFGTFPDPVDCGVFWKCMDGKPNKYNCPPGLAYDQVSRGCRWADQVPECSGNTVTIDEEGGEFQCPAQTTAGVFTKHAHPADCRQYFLCIGGIPREYGCPLGQVFDLGTGDGTDGKCTDPDNVPECASYYEGQDLGDLSRTGADTGPRESEGRARPSNPRKIHRNPASLQRTNSFSEPSNPAPARESHREKSRPAPASLQNIVDTDRAQPPRSRPSRPEHSRPKSSSQRTGGQGFRPEEDLESLPPVKPNSNRLTPIRIDSSPDTTKRPQIPSRLQVLTDRPNTRTTFPRRPEPPTTTVPPTTNSRFSPSSKSPSRFTPPQSKPQTEAPVARPAAAGLPTPVKAAPGPNGEEYYYYYYYYDDEDDSKNDINAAPGS